MTEHRVNPLQWLSTKFASLNHSHNEYLTSHQDITGKEDKTNKSSSISTDTGSTTKYPTVKAVEDYAQPKGNYLTQHQSLKTVNNESLVGTGNITIDSGSDIDIVTDWESTLSDEKVASEKLVKESIDSVLYETEDITLRTPSTSSNVNFTIISEEDTNTITIPTLNSCRFNYPSLEGFLEYEFDLNFPTNEDAIFVFGEDSGFSLFRTSSESSHRMNFGDCYWNKNIQYDNNFYVESFSSIKITVQLGINSSKIYLNDYDNTYREIYYSNYVMFSSNVTINSITAKLYNVPKQLSRYVDDITKVKELPNNADLNFLNEDITYIGYNDNNSMSHCPVSDKTFILINKDIPYDYSYRAKFQQILITLNGAYGSYEEVWVRYQEPSTGGFDGSWTKLISTNDIDSVVSSIESLKQISSKYFKQEDFLNPDCWYTDWDNHSYRPTYSDGTLSFNNRSWYLFNFDNNYELLDDYTMEILYSIVGSPMLLINETTIPLSSNSNRIYIYTDGGNTYIEYDSESTQTITGKMETFQVRVNATNSSFEITNFTFNSAYPSNNLWDKKQDTLISGTNLKTINNESLLGNGNISMIVDSTWVNNSTNPVESQLIKTALDGKSNTSHTHSQYLTQHQSLAGYLQTSDVKDNLTSTDTNKPLSAKQGQELKTLVDGKANTTHFHSDLSQSIQNLGQTISGLAEVATSGDYDDLINTPENLSDFNDDVGYLTSHQSLTNYVTTSDSRLSDSRTPIAHATSATTYGVSSASDYGHAMASSTSPKANGTAAVGSETAKFARGDHVHPHSCVNNLTSTSTTTPLAANQGKVLNEKKLEKTTQSTIIVTEAVSKYDNLVSYITLYSGGGGVYAKSNGVECSGPQARVYRINTSGLGTLVSSNNEMTLHLLHDFANIGIGDTSSASIATNQSEIDITIGRANNMAYVIVDHDNTEFYSWDSITDPYPDLYIGVFAQQASTITITETTNHIPSSQEVTAQINAIADVVYPVGSIYMSVNSTSPQTLFGGRWEQLKDRFLLGSGDTYSAGVTGGSATVTLTANQSGVPAHSHKYNDYNTTYTLKTTNRKPGTSTAVAYGTSLTAGGGATERTSSNNTAADASQAHENMPPYLTVYMWKRIA